MVGDKTTWTFDLLANTRKNTKHKFAQGNQTRVRRDAGLSRVFYF